MKKCFLFPFHDQKWNPNEIPREYEFLQHYDNPKIKNDTIKEKKKNTSFDRARFFLSKKFA